MRSGTAASARRTPNAGPSVRSVTAAMMSATSAYTSSSGAGSSVQSEAWNASPSSVCSGAGKRPGSSAQTCSTAPRSKSPAAIHPRRAKYRAGTKRGSSSDSRASSWSIRFRRTIASAGEIPSSSASRSSPMPLSVCASDSTASSGYSVGSSSEPVYSSAASRTASTRACANSACSSSSGRKKRGATSAWICRGAPPAFVSHCAIAIREVYGRGRDAVGASSWPRAAPLDSSV